VRRMLRSTTVRLAAAVVAALAVGGGAYAFYTSTGQGGGSASVASPDPLTITAQTPASGLLYPGASGEVDASISNPNPFGLRVNSLVLGSNGISVDGVHAGCDTAALHYAAQDNGGGGWDIPPRVGLTDGTLDVPLPDAISMDTSAADAFQGATFTVSLATGP
jgi:hypothetical protein